MQRNARDAPARAPAAAAAQARSRHRRTPIVRKKFREMAAALTGLGRPARSHWILNPRPAPGGAQRPRPPSRAHLYAAFLLPLVVDKMSHLGDSDLFVVFIFIF